MQLKFNINKTFKIVQFTDVHWNDGGESDQLTRKLMDLVLKEEQPDLVVFTGDLVYCEHNEKQMHEVLKSVAVANVPFATVFGNHDDEFGFDRREMLRLKQQYPNCLDDSTHLNESGLYDYYLTIESADSPDSAYTLFLMDSGNYLMNEQVGWSYAHFRREQINWFEQQSQKFLSVPSLAFFHIPLPEFNEVWDTQICYGEKNEAVCCSKINSGLFSAMLEVGNVRGVFVGHDHLNDYRGELYGIQLCYGRATGYNTYGNEQFKHGARVIELKENKPGFKTWVRLDDNSVILNPIKHDPENKK